MGKKFLLCRPRGGLNDSLCQIQRCFEYCRKHQRVLVLDSHRSGLRDDLFRYFEVVDTVVETMTWAEFSQSHNADEVSIYPQQTQGRLDTYETQLGESGIYFDTQNSVSLSFDFGKSYSEDLLLHEACGGGINSVWLLKYLQPTPFLRQHLETRLSALPTSYRAVHIRNTDLETDHNTLFHELEFVLANQNVLFCTDSGKLQAKLKDAPPKGTTPYFLTSLDHSSNDRLHESENTSIESNLDMLTDLFALARAKKLYFTFTKAGYISGFSGLAFALHCSKLRNRVAPMENLSASNHIQTSHKSGAFRFLKAQAAIIAAKLAYRVLMGVHESWPSR